MSGAPEKMWVFPKADWFNAGASNARISSAGANDVEYTRTDMARAYLADYRAAYEGSCEQVEELQAEVARLREALEHSKTGWENIIELELLDPAYDFTASDLLYEARAALEYKD